MNQKLPQLPQLFQLRQLFQLFQLAQLAQLFQLGQLAQSIRSCPGSTAKCFFARKLELKLLDFAIFRTKLVLEEMVLALLREIGQPKEMTNAIKVKLNLLNNLIILHLKFSR